MTMRARFMLLAAAFVLIATLIASMAAQTVTDNRVVIARYQDASANALRGERLNRYLVTIAVELRGLYMSKTREETLWRADRVDENVNKLEALVADWYTHVKRGDLPELDAVSDAIKPAAAGSHNLARLGREVSREAAEAAGNHDQFRSGREAMQAKLDVMIVRLETRLRASREAVDRFEHERLQTFLIIAASGIGLLLAGSWWIAASLAARLKQIRRSIVSISEGAYDTLTPASGSGDEIGEIWGALDILKERAREADRLTHEKLREEQRLRELMLD